MLSGQHRGPRVVDRERHVWEAVVVLALVDVGLGLYLRLS